MFVLVLLTQLILKCPIYGEVNQIIEPNPVSTCLEAYSGYIYLSLTWHVWSAQECHITYADLVSSQREEKKKTIICHLVCRATQRCVNCLLAGFSMCRRAVCGSLQCSERLGWWRDGDGGWGGLGGRVGGLDGSCVEPSVGDSLSVATAPGCV